MNIRRSFGEKVFSVLNSAFMLFIVIITLYPFIYVVFASVSEPFGLMGHRGLLLKPVGFSLDAYKLVFKNPMIWISYKNTLVYVAAGTAVNMIMTTLGAYVLSRKGIKWKKYIMAMIVVTMFFSGGLVPKYLLIRELHWINTIWAIIIPNAISAYYLIIMRTHFMGIPDSFEESAKIDGANDFVVLWKVIIPLAMPVIAVVVLFYAVAHWNSWFPESIYLPDRNKFPFQLILREILIATSSSSMTVGEGRYERASLEMTIRHATIIVATIPILLAYPYLQKYFVKGVMIGSLKG